MPAPNDKIPHDDFAVRYERQIRFEPFGLSGQHRLARAAAVIIGMGGLGSWTAEFLVRSGIGRLRICDSDCVELSNLPRQALYTLDDARRRRLKVAAAADRLCQLSDQVVIEPFPERVDYLNIARAVADTTLILDGTDNFLTRYLINDYAVKYQLPWIMAGVETACGQLMTFIPARTGCLRCLLPDLPQCSELGGCQRHGVLGPVPPLIAARQALEALKILSGSSQLCLSNISWADFWTNQSRQMSPLTPQPQCPCCARHDFIYLEP